jgi:hypothetical protein
MTDEVVPAAPPPTQFNAYTMLADGVTKDYWVAGGYDDPSVISLAGAFYIARTQYNLNPQLLVGVFDNTGALVAFIGRWQPAP